MASAINVEKRSVVSGLRLTLIPALIKYNK